MTPRSSPPPPIAAAELDGPRDQRGRTDNLAGIPGESCLIIGNSHSLGHPTQAVLGPASRVVPVIWRRPLQGSVAMLLLLVSRSLTSDPIGHQLWASAQERWPLEATPVCRSDGRPG